jgi:O-antigen/teichoic acid export membrane protein
LSWRTDILPFQWRIALSWVSGYFASSLFIPVLFYYHGAIVAGQMGMTWTLTSTVLSIGLAWISPRVPQFGMLVAQKRYAEMDRLFWRLTVVVAGVTILAATAVLLLVFGLNFYEHPLSHRILPPLPTTLFLSAIIFYAAAQTMSAYLRAHKKEPLLHVSVLVGLFVGLSTWLLGKYYAALGMAVGYLAISALMFPIIVMVWRHCRKTWHAA